MTSLSWVNMYMVTQNYWLTYTSLVANVEQLKQQAKEAVRLADKLKFDLDRAEKDKTNLIHKAEMQRADLNVKHEKEKQSIQR